MAGLDHYSVAVFIHILGALALFVALAVEWLCLRMARAATTNAQSDAVAHALAAARRIGPVAMGLLLVPRTVAEKVNAKKFGRPRSEATVWLEVRPTATRAENGLVGRTSGGLMVLSRWNSLGWPAAGLIGMTGIVVVGLVMRRWPTLALQSVESRIAIALGVVALMVFKLDLSSSLVILGAAAVVGAGASLVVHRGARTGKRRMGKLRPNSIIAQREWKTITGEQISVPDSARLVHLQFRRFAGCPVCNLHLRSIVRRHAEIQHAGVHEVVVFHSTRQELLDQAAGLPFAVNADPRKELYAEFGVEASPRALLDPRVWLPILAGTAASALAILRRQGRAPSLIPTGGRLGLPGDFLIASDGRLVAVKYGVHAYDQWSVDELLDLAGREAQSSLRRGIAKPQTAATSSL